MQLAQKRVERALTQKGFERTESHHSYFKYITVDGLITPVYTYTSHGNPELGDFLIKEMAGQLRLSKNQFLDLSQCPMSREAYEAILVAGGHV